MAKVSEVKPGVPDRLPALRNMVALRGAVPAFGSLQLQAAMESPPVTQPQRAVITPCTVKQRPQFFSSAATLLDASRFQWLGIVHAPDGVAGLSFGEVHVSTGRFTSESHTGGEGSAGTSEGRLNGEGFYTDPYNVLSSMHQQAVAMAVGLVGAVPAADQLGRDGEAAFATDGHAIEPQENSRLVKAEQPGCAQTIMDEGRAFNANNR